MKVFYWVIWVQLDIKRSKFNFWLRPKVIIKELSPNYRKQFTSKLKEMLV